METRFDKDGSRDAPRDQVRIDFGSALLAGFAGTVVMTVLLFMANAMGLVHMDIAMMLGTMPGLTGSAAFWAGMAMHFMIGTLFWAPVYGVAFQQLGRAPSWSMGAALGIPHWMVFGVMLGMISSIHPAMRSGVMPAPGWFAINQGMMGLLGPLLLHVAYGSVVGGLTRAHALR